jgi:hypothetical protein
MPYVRWSGRPADPKLVEQLRGRGIRIAAEAEAAVVAEVVATAAARVGSVDGASNGVPWIWFAASAVSTAARASSPV